MAIRGTPGSPVQRTDVLRDALAKQELARMLAADPTGHPPGCKCADHAGEDGGQRLDVFESSVLPGASVALADRDRVDGVDGESFTGEKELGQDEQVAADSVADLLEDDEDDNSEEDEEDDSFDFLNPGGEKLAGWVDGLVPEDGAPADGPATHPERGSREEFEGGDGEQGKGDEIFGMGSAQEMMGQRWQETQEELDVMTGLLDEMTGTTTSKTSVATGNDPTQVDHDAITDDQAVKDITDIVDGRHNDGLTEPDGPPEDMTDEVVEAVGGFLGRYTPAGKVAGAFIKGWNLGREIDEATGAGETAGEFYGVQAAKLNEAVGITDEAAYAKEQEAKAAEAQAKRAAAEAKKAEEEAAKKAKEAKKADTETSAPDDPEGGPPTEAALAFRRHLYNATGYKGPGAGERGGEVDPTEESAERSNVRVAPTGIRAQGQEGHLGQPAADERVGGSRPTGGGNLPGDQGNIDFGEENETGQFTTTQLGGDPADLDTSPGSSPIARRDSDDDEDSGEDDAGKGGYVSVVKSAVRVEDTRGIVGASRRGFGDDDED